MQMLRDVRDVQMARRFGLREFAEFSDEQIFQGIEDHRAEVHEGHDVRDLKVPEWQVFSNPNATSSADLQLRTVATPQGYSGTIGRVVLIEHMREVRALTGFTRIDPPGEDGQATRVPITRTSPTWVPAAEVRGEGIFVQFLEEELQAWERDARSLDQQFMTAHRRWRQSRGLDPTLGYPGLRYVVLHSFAHAIIRHFSIECGYTMASLRERIYCRLPGAEAPMAGVLIYTAAPDSEGTLGGLVSMGMPDAFGPHVDAALESLELCASDPLCAESLPDQQILALHGAACHACLFAPETSCERGNRYLDRSVLVETVERRGWSFFR